MSLFRTTLLMAALTGLFLAVGMVIAGPAGMTITFILALVLNLFNYWYADKIALFMSGAKPSADHELNEIVSKVAKKAGLPKPKVYIVETHAPNAFATGRDPNHAAVAATRGLLDRLSSEEIEAVIAHEMAHIKNRDILVSSMAAVIGGAISYLANLAWWGAFSRDNDRGGNIMLLPLVILAPIAAMLIHMAISRGREFGADKSGAEITKNPKALARALEKISDAVSNNPVKGNSATAHMWIVNPFSADAMAKLFSTHPPTEERIERLNQMKF